MPSEEIFSGMCEMMKRKNGATAIEMQYKYKLPFEDTVFYILEAEKMYDIVKKGRKLQIIAKKNKKESQKTKKHTNFWKVGWDLREKRRKK